MRYFSSYQYFIGSKKFVERKILETDDHILHDQDLVEIEYDLKCEIENRYALVKDVNNKEMTYKKVSCAVKDLCIISLNKLEEPSDELTVFDKISFLVNVLSEMTVKLESHELTVKEFIENAKRISEKLKILSKGTNISLM